MSSEKEVIRIHASLDVTLMQNTKSLRNEAVHELP